MADEENDRIIAFNPRQMTLKVIISTNGSAPYPVDQAGAEHVYAITRGSKSIDVISNQNLKRIRTIPLAHYPRSAAYNKVNRLAIVSGRKKPVTSVIDTKTHQVVATVGTDSITTPNDFGGSLATGHPFWVTEDKFLLLDRANRKIELYVVSENKGKYDVLLSDSLMLNTSVHHVLSVPNAQGSDKNMGKNNRFYGIAEGAPNDDISPGVIEFDVSGEKLIKRKTIHVLTNEVDAEDMGSHHATFHPDGKHIYLGSNEGFTYVINRLSMSVVKTIKTGLGNGHTTMIPGRMIGVSTNHNDRFMTILNLTTHEKIIDVYISDLATDPKRKTQSHTSSFDPENDRFFYTAASNEGRIIEIDLEKFSVSREIEFKCGSYPIQGTFVWRYQNLIPRINADQPPNYLNPDFL